MTSRMNDTSSEPASIEASTVTEVLSAYAEGGFTGEFSAVEGAQLECHSCDTTVGADEVVMSSLRRLEGASDPADMVAVVALTCPACGARGATVLAFGPAASAEDSDVLGALRDHRHDVHAPGNSAPGEVAGDDTATA
ncbi:MAG: hypothetical protein JWL72_2007 [Ilumatobacteraceae bacterium]|nr:hypothetical protein [Ilumatobacteraceae bacterium]